MYRYNFNYLPQNWFVNFVRGSTFFFLCFHFFRFLLRKGRLNVFLRFLFLQILCLPKRNAVELIVRDTDMLYFFSCGLYIFYLKVAINKYFVYSN